ncbi:MAG: hypothetical protein ACMG6E_03120 [Candidatus Roizmanbacteria bacterium]
MYTSDYVLAHSFLAACTESNAATPVKTFSDAVGMLNGGRSAAAIHSVLFKVQRFKALLPVAPPAPTAEPKPMPEFAMPAPLKITPQKRPTVEKTRERENSKVPSKIQKQSTLNFKVSMILKH